jgi:hypothetical protein
VDNARAAWNLPTSMRTATRAPLAVVGAFTCAACVACVMWGSLALGAPGGAAGGDVRAASEALERVRGDPKLADDPAAIEALARAAETFPPGLVRVEARMLVAEAWLGRMQRPEDAIAELRRVTDDVSGDPAADMLTARLAEHELVDALAAARGIGAAQAEAHAGARLLDPRFVQSIDRLARRRWLLGAAILVLTVFAALAAAALARARRRRALGEAARAVGGVAPGAATFLAFLALAGGGLAARSESGSATPFLLFGAAALPLVLLARAWGAVGSTRRAGRLGRSALCAGAVLAAAFVLLDVVNPAYLEGFGL